MALPSLQDVIVVIVLVVPGFIVFSIVRWMGGIERRFSEFETIIWCVMLSLTVYGIFSFATGIADFDTLKDSIFQPGILAVLIVTTFLVAMSISLSWHLVANRGIRPRIGHPWDLFFDSMTSAGRDLVVFTEDGTEFKGWVGVSGTEDNRLELVLVNPRLVIRGDYGNILGEIPYGDQMLFTADDIRRVAMLEPRLIKPGSGGTDGID